MKQESTGKPILQVRDLSVAYTFENSKTRFPARAAGRTELTAVQNVSFELLSGQILGLVGESGSGKSTVAQAIMGALPANARIVSGEIWFQGQNLVALHGNEIRQLWGRSIALVPQNAQGALNPTRQIGDQFVEVLQYQHGYTRPRALERMLELFHLVHLAEPTRIAYSYPFQLSGGMQQRILIALALGGKPRLLILDEPTSNLDATTQAAIIKLIQELAENGYPVENDTRRLLTAIYISHDLSAVTQLCQQVAVLYAGEWVEEAPTRTLLYHPSHPYTQMLLESIPVLGRHKSSGRLTGIPGSPPALDARPPGCGFAPRCPYAKEICTTSTPVLSDVTRVHQASSPSEYSRKRGLSPVGHTVHCHRWNEISWHGQNPLLDSPRDGATSPMRIGQDFSQPVSSSGSPPQDLPLLRANRLAVHFYLRPEDSFPSQPDSMEELILPTPSQYLPILLSPLHSLLSLPYPVIRAVDDISFELFQGKVLGIVGESGSGKSTIARTIIGLEASTSGKLDVFGRLAADGEILPPYLSQRSKALLSSIQMVFQDVTHTLNPARTVAAALERPFRSLMGLSKKEARGRVSSLLAVVHLPPGMENRYPGQLSGGEKQRVAIARAIATRPALLIADEAVSALDASIQASIISLLDELYSTLPGQFSRKDSNSLIFISHSLAAAAYIADDLIVMYRGKIVEFTSANSLLAPPHHPYTQALLAAAAVVRASSPMGEDEWAASVPSVGGCPYAHACPRYIGPICKESVPPWQEVPGGKRIACHIPLEDLLLPPEQLREDFPDSPGRSRI